jgi:hypothetical protein
MISVPDVDTEVMFAQFAYNEASFMLVRLLQAFKSIRVDLDANPKSRPPPAWANGPGRKAVEKVWMKSHVSCFFSMFSIANDHM